MIFEIEHGIATGDGRSGVTLAPAGASSLGFPTKIDVIAGPLRGIVADDTTGSCERLQRQLVDLYTWFSGPGPLRSGRSFFSWGVSRHVHLLLALLAAIALLAAPAASAQTWPTHPIRLVVPFAAGGANDIVARLIQPDLERALGQPIIIENKPAAGGTVGTDQVAKAAPDGYSLLMAFTTHTVNPAVNAKLPYDTERDLAPVVLVGKSPLLFIVNPSVPAKTLSQFVALAKQNPGKFNYGTTGATSQAHLLMALWSKLAGIEMQHVPYRGGAPAVLGTVAGAIRIFPTCQALPRAVFRASKLWPGPACSPRPERRQRSSAGLMRK
jgi:hypothetical protein